jgi:hypothetical protein
VNRLCCVLAIASGIVLGSALAAVAGAPQPETRAGDFAHACRSGANKGGACSVATEAADCPGSECVLQASRRTVRGVLTIVAHDGVTDWKNGGAANQAITATLEVRGLDGSRQILAATYQDLVVPSEPPQAPGNVVSIPLDEQAVRQLAPAAAGLRLLQPESTLAQRLRDLYSEDGIPVLTVVEQRSALLADHTADDLATVLRLRVKIQFVARK